MTLRPRRLMAPMKAMWLPSGLRARLPIWPSILATLAISPPEALTDIQVAIGRLVVGLGDAVGSEVDLRAILGPDGIVFGEFASG